MNNFLFLLLLLHIAYVDERLNPPQSAPDDQDPDLQTYLAGHQKRIQALRRL